MSYLGKKYQRTGCENFDHYFSIGNLRKPYVDKLKAAVPSFVINKDDNDIYSITMTEPQHKYELTYKFEIGKEIELKKRDGRTMKITFYKEGDDVLIQKLILSGKTSYFKKVFNGNTMVQTCTMEGTDAEAKVYYKLVDK